LEDAESPSPDPEILSNELLDNLELIEDEDPKKNTKTEELKGEDEESNILSSPSEATEDIVAFSDIPIMSVDIQSLEPNSTVPIGLDSETIENSINLLSEMADRLELEDGIYLTTRSKKPRGSAYVHAKMKLSHSKYPIEGYVCVDTGADITLCDSAYLLAHFGKDAAKHLIPIDKPPKLRSATGHNLEILGTLSILLYLGEYEMEVQIIVYEGTSCIFLLGNDSFYGRLIYDRGMFLSFADENYPPIPIQYQLDKDKVKALKEYSVAPKTHALIQVKVTNCPQLTGKEIILTPLEDGNEGFCRNCSINCDGLVQNEHLPVRNTIAVIDSLGCAPLLVQNDTEDILTIYPNNEIALVNFISEQGNEINKISFEIEKDLLQPQPKDGWPYSALKGELKDRIPPNMIVQWDKIPGKAPEDPANEPHEINYVHDKEERKHLLDGTGEGFPTPPAPDSIHPDADLDSGPEAWLKDVDHSHLSDPQWDKLKKVLLDHSAAFSKI
jgi:hypothetical protein